jgi:transposase-like protein
MTTSLPLWRGRISEVVTYFLRLGLLGFGGPVALEGHHRRNSDGHSIQFKRQVAQDFIAGETLHGLARRHDVSRNLIRIWVRKYEEGDFDDDTPAADLIQEYETRIAALEWLVRRQVLELEILMGVLRSATMAERHDHIRHCRPVNISAAEGCRLMGLARPTSYDRPDRAADDTAIMVLRQRGIASAGRHHRADRIPAASAHPCDG